MMLSKSYSVLDSCNSYVDIVDHFCQKIEYIIKICVYLSRTIKKNCWGDFVYIPFGLKIFKNVSGWIDYVKSNDGLILELCEVLSGCWSHFDQISVNMVDSKKDLIFDKSNEEEDEEEEELTIPIDIDYRVIQLLNSGCLNEESNLDFPSSTKEEQNLLKMENFTELDKYEKMLNLDLEELFRNVNESLNNYHSVFTFIDLTVKDIKNQINYLRYCSKMEGRFQLFEDYDISLDVIIKIIYDITIRIDVHKFCFLEKMQSFDKKNFDECKELQSKIISTDTNYNDYRKCEICFLKSKSSKFVGWSCKHGNNVCLKCVQKIVSKSVDKGNFQNCPYCRSRMREFTFVKT